MRLTRLTRYSIPALASGLIVAAASSAAAQDHVRISVNAAAQVSERPFSETLKFQQYLEDGDLVLDRTIPKKPVFDGGVLVHIVDRLYAGASFSSYSSNGSGTVTAHVPHPLFFGQPRTSTGEVTGVNREETATHIQVGWTVPASGGLDFTPFVGPSMFQVSQVFVTKLNLSLDNEVYPYDTLAFPGVATETIKDRMTGYNVGVDMTWRFMKALGVGALIRYSHATKDFTPTGGEATKVEVGGLLAGGGLRVIF